MGKTKGKRRPSSEQEQTKEQVPQRGFKEAHVSAMVNKGQNPRKKPTSTKQKQTAEKVPQCSQSSTTFKISGTGDKNGYFSTFYQIRSKVSHLHIPLLLSRLRRGEK